jgi:hypothetical protein
VFDLYPQDRLIEWRRFRDSIEDSDNPLTSVAELWSRAPFVNPYLNPTDPKSWPDPWHLVMDGKFDDLAIVLGMLYTIKLTQRFINTHCEIHMSTSSKNSDRRFFLIVENLHVLNLEPRKSVNLSNLTMPTNIIWPESSLQ